MKSPFHRPKFTPICSWIVDQQDNQYCFDDFTHMGLYRAEEPDSQGKRYVTSSQIRTSCTWISDEEALKIMKRHLGVLHNLEQQELELLDNMRSEHITARVACTGDLDFLKVLHDDEGHTLDILSDINAILGELEAGTKVQIMVSTRGEE